MSIFLQPVSPVQGYNETVSNVTASNSVIVGQQWGDSSGNLYVYVYNAGTQQISQGQFAVLATNVSGYSVTVSSTTFSDAPIGMVRNTTITTGAYGWLMYRGFSGISTDTASFVTGQVLLAGSNGNFQAGVATTGSFVTSPIIGKALVSIPTQTTCSTAGNANACWINIA